MERRHEAACSKVTPENLPPLHAPLGSIRCPERRGTRLGILVVFQEADPIMELVRRLNFDRR
jgi:hypothetical protein